MQRYGFAHGRTVRRSVIQYHYTESGMEQMSQAKVDKQKAYKKNRKKIMAREKRKHTVARWIGYLCLVCVIGGVGFSFYQKLNPAPAEDSSAFYSLIATDDYGILHPTLSE